VSKFLGTSKQISALVKNNEVLTNENCKMYARLAAAEYQLQMERKRNAELSKSNEAMRIFFEKTKGAMDEVAKSVKR
jgi:regulator of replication initiation timing